MKKRFLGALATGLFLFGIAGFAQALPITINAELYTLDPDLVYDADPENAERDLAKDQWVDDNIYSYDNSLILYGFTTENSSVSQNEPINALKYYLESKSLIATLLYKSEFDNGEDIEQPLFDSYGTNFNTDASGGSITYSGGDFIGSPAFLMVKDGQADPKWYIFDLTQLGWNGQLEIILQGFWPDGGAISNIGIYGTSNPIPEPGTMLLFGTGLAGLAAVGRRRKN